MSGRILGNSILVACAVATTGCSYINGGITGSGVPASEARKISDDFTKIRDDGFANVDVQVGPAVSVRVEGDDNIVPLVKTEIRDGELVISTKRSVRPTKRLLVTVTVPNLEAFSLDGAANVKVNGIKGDQFKVSLDGAGNVELGGHTNALSASLDGAGNLRMAGLESREANVSVDGAGNVELWATGRLAASIDGMGNIKYKGNAKVTQSISGMGKVEQID